MSAYDPNTTKAAPMPSSPALGVQVAVFEHILRECRRPGD
jgi:hypothetical protein